jgi:hypothetical protein
VAARLACHVVVGFRFLGPEQQSVEFAHAQGPDVLRRASGAAQQHLADPRIDVDIPGEPAEGIEARGQRHSALKRDGAVGGAQADEPAEARRCANRATRVGTERDVGQPARHGRGRAGGGAAGHPARRGRVDRFGKMGVLAHQREGQFVGLRAPHESGAGIEELLQGRRGAFCYRRFGELVRIAAAGLLARNVVDVLDGQRQARERPVIGVRNLALRPIQEGIQGIPRGKHRSLRFDVRGSIVHRRILFNRAWIFR